MIMINIGDIVNIIAIVIIRDPVHQHHHHLMIISDVQRDSNKKTKNVIRWAFRMYDKDGSGEIDLDEMTEIFCLMYSIQVSTYMLDKSFEQIFIILITITVIVQKRGSLRRRIDHHHHHHRHHHIHQQGFTEEED